MTDHDLAEMLAFAQLLEARTRALVKTEDLAERDQAVNVTRLATPLRRNLETWISLRALRAQLSVGVR